MLTTIRAPTCKKRKKVQRKKNKIKVGGVSNYEAHGTSKSIYDTLSFSHFHP